jgi:O-methyltransferase involved in polyketide biosynthesis
MARKFAADSPQLADMVLARTIHCDRALKSFAKANNRFTVVNIGSGYDSRPWRLKGLGEAAFVQIDLPAMCEDATRVLPPVDQSEYRVVRPPST